MQSRAHTADELGVDLRALAPLLEKLGPLAVVDLETTGLSNDPEAEILEVGVVLLDPGSTEIETHESLVAPRGPIPLAVQRLTGLVDADTKEAPAIEEIAAPLARALDGRTVIAHNADFERYFLTRYVAPELASTPFLDTQDLLSITHPDAPDMRLETFTRDLFGEEERHRALSDALDTLRVLSRVALGAEEGEARYAVARSAFESYSPESPWLEVLDGGGFAARAKGDRSAAPGPAQYVSIPKTSETPVPFDEDAIAAVLGDAERGRRHFPGYRVREQQIEMAREFVRALADGGRLLLEGGTGVGKSLAYLAAAIPFAMERAAGGIRDPIVVSTRTKLLQDQLLKKDIPAAAAMLGYPDLRALSIKGRANYVCARRVGQVLAEGREPSIFADDRLAYAALAACARTRPHGEVSSLPGALLFRYPPLRDLVRRSVAARAEQCSREQCAGERDCPLGRRRSALGNAHLVVANHDLLLRWPPDYPNFTHAIVDEAHELAGVADEVYATEVRPDAILERLDELFGRPSTGGASKGRRESLLRPGRVRVLEKDARAWRRGIQQDLVELGRSLSTRASEFGEVQLPPHAAVVMPESAKLADTAARRLDDVAVAVDQLEPRVSSDDDAERDEAEEALARAVADLREAADALRGAFSGADGAAADRVAAFERLEPPYDRWRLMVRHVSPASIFHEAFAQKLETLACVSASLFVGGDAFAALGELEVENRSEVGSHRVSVESPFPYDRHMRVVALQSRGDLVEETVDVIAELATELGGRTLGLFTSLRRMNQAAELLSQRLRGQGFDILTPRRAHDDPAALVERFRRAEGGGILLGARTFWQGVDIPGDALQAVVIEKLPFEVPTELRKRRQERIDREGDNAFERFTLGKMLLNLKQMVGRLIRTEEDRGLVVIVEGRTDKRYFRQLGGALPPGNEVIAIGRDELTSYLDEVGIAES